MKIGIAFFGSKLDLWCISKVLSIFWTFLKCLNPENHWKSFMYLAYSSLRQWRVGPGFICTAVYDRWARNHFSFSIFFFLFFLSFSLLFSLSCFSCGPSSTSGRRPWRALEVWGRGSRGPERRGKRREEGRRRLGARFEGRGRRGKNPGRPAARPCGGAEWSSWRGYWRMGFGR